ncbi:hypothetical protein [Lactococcus protaetiae]|uniref:Uncharacterized protein n=1 Tax=Lactococcus protaetiae TaxID=2592653 RepID=A0A514ZAW1_9LACT|nr:hypothetical protein [Lactococcus protaetiae]MCL2112876.1 hypothetical protein [Streptococcaceae bacterium]QDK71716.1 hypothetical protein FLP15_11735 [Lactococcus protaetiae]
MKHVEVTVNKHEMLVFDDMGQCNSFIDSFTRDFEDNIIMGAPKEIHPDYVEMSAIFYNPYHSRPEGQEVVLLDIHIPK